MKIMWLSSRICANSTSLLSEEEKKDIQCLTNYIHLHFKPIIVFMWVFRESFESIVKESFTMESDLKIRKVTQDVLKFSCFKHQIIEEKPSQDLLFTREITPQFMNNVCKVIWFLSLVKDVTLSGFFQKHFQRMTSSPEMFTKYVSFACYDIDDTTDEYEIFLGTLSMVTYFGFRCWEKGSKKFLNVCVDLFCAFYEKELRSKFESRGGLQNFIEHLENELKDKNMTHILNEYIPSFRQFNKREDTADMKESLKLINHEIESISQTEVETDERVTSFTKSVSRRIEDLCRKTFDEILVDFAETDSQVEEMYRLTFGQTADELSSELNPISSQKGKEEIIKKIRHNKFELQELVKQIVTSNISDTQKSDIATETSSQLSPKSEKIRKLLDDISLDYLKLNEIIQTLSEEHGVQLSEPMEAETKA